MFSGTLYSLDHSFTLEESGALWAGGEQKFSGSSLVSACAGLPHFAVTGVAISSAPGDESAAGVHLKADPRRDQLDFVTANFREFDF